MSVDLDSFVPMQGVQEQKKGKELFSDVDEDTAIEGAHALGDDSFLEELLHGDILPLLEKIETNTRGGSSSVAEETILRAKGASNETAAEHIPTPTQHAANTTPEVPISILAQTENNSENENTPAIKPQELIANELPVSPAKDSLEPAYLPTETEIEVTPKWKVLDESLQVSAPFADTSGTKSEQAISDMKEASKDGIETKGLRDYFKNFSGELGAERKPEGVSELAGSAAGGALWSAAMEIKEAADGLGDIGENDGSVTGILKQVVADKTGLTALNEKRENAREHFVDKIQTWANKGELKEESLPEGYKRDKNGKLRNEKGNFVSEEEERELIAHPPASVKAEQNPDPAEKVNYFNEKELSPLQAISHLPQQHSNILETPSPSVQGIQELPSASVDANSDPQSSITEPIVEKLSQQNDDAEKRNDELKATVANSANASESGGGLLDMLGGREGRGRNRRGGKRKGKFGKLGGVLASVVGGGGVLSTLFGGDSGVADAAMDTAEDTALNKLEGKAGASVAGKLEGKAGQKLAGKVGTKGLGKIGARAIPVIGQVIAAGMAIADGVEGWNDDEMQKDAFHLKDGQEASTGQKTASAVANALDMGGLVTGGLSMLGLDVDTADIAKALYSPFAETDREEKLAVEAAPLQPQRAQAEALTAADALKAERTDAVSEQRISSIVEKKTTQISPNTPEISSKAQDGRIDKLISMLEKNLKNTNQPVKGYKKAVAEEVPNIPTNFDDDVVMTLLLADRI